MSYLIIESLYSPLKKHGIYEDFLTWADNEDLLYKKPFFETIDDNEEIVVLINAIMQYSEKRITSEDIKVDIRRYITGNR